MGTRFYYPSTGTPDVTVTPDAAWDDTSSYASHPLQRIKLGTALADVVTTNATATANLDILQVQYISAPLDAQTISGTVKGYIRAIESDASHNLRSQVIIRLVSNDGQTVRGTLYAGDGATGTSDPTSEWDNATYRNRQFPRGSSQSLTSQSASAGDRIVVEIGYRKHAATSTTGTIRVGESDYTSTDLVEDESGSSDYNPWIEFSGDLLGGFSGTRFYFPSSGTAPVSPSFGSIWEQTTGADRLPMSTERGSTALANKQAAQPAVNFNGQDLLVRQYVSEYPLAAQTISGFVLGVFRLLESDDAADYSPQCMIRVMAPDGTTVRGTLFGGHFLGTGNEPNATTLESRIIPRSGTGQTALSSVTAQAGDYLVVDLGAHSHGGATTAFTIDYNCGEDASDPLAPGETDQNARHPWLNFGQTLAFITPVVITPPAATVTATAQPPRLAVRTPAATASGAGQTPTVRRTLAAPPAAANGAALAPALALRPPTGSVSATALAPVVARTAAPAAAGASGAALTPALRLPLAIPATAGSATALTPATRGRATPPVATANGVAQAPVITLPVAATLASGAATAPSVRSTARAPLATGAGAALPPALRVTVAAPLATASGAAHAPRLAVLTPTTTANAAAPEPDVQQTASTVTIVVPLAVASGAVALPALHASLLPPSVTASGGALAPALRGPLTPAAAAATASAAPPGVRGALAIPAAAGTAQAVSPMLAISVPAAIAAVAGVAPTLTGALGTTQATALATVPAAAVRGAVLAPLAVASGAAFGSALALRAPVAAGAGAAHNPLPRAAIGAPPAIASGQAPIPDIPALGVTIIAAPTATASGAGQTPTLAAALPQPVAAGSATAQTPTPRAAMATPRADASGSAASPRLTGALGSSAAQAGGAAPEPAILVFCAPSAASASGSATPPGLLVDVLVPIAVGNGQVAAPAVVARVAAPAAAVSATGLSVTLPTLAPPVLIVRAPLRSDPVLGGAVTTADVLAARLRVAPVLSAKHLKVEQ